MLKWFRNWLESRRLSREQAWKNYREDSMKYLSILLLVSGACFAADTITITPQDGATTVVITITLDVTDEKAAAVAAKSVPGATLASVKQAYAQAMIPRLYRAVEQFTASIRNNDTMIDAAAAKAAADAAAQAAAIKALRPTIPDPTK